MHTTDNSATPLASMMEQLRIEMAGMSTPPSVQAALAKAFAQQHRQPRWWQRHTALAWRVGGAAGAGALLLLLVLGMPQHPAAPGGAPGGAPQQVAAAAAPAPARPASAAVASVVRTAPPAPSHGHRKAPPAVAAPVAPTLLAAATVEQPDDGFSDGVAFVALESFDSINAQSSTRLIRKKLQRIELASLGVNVTPQNAEDTVQAEILVGADGEALALRLLTLN